MECHLFHKGEHDFEPLGIEAEHESPPLRVLLVAVRMQLSPRSIR
jgi:hypothetical protein